MFLVPVWIYLLQTSLDSFSKFQSLLVTNMVLFKILTGDDNIASGFNSFSLLGLKLRTGIEEPLVTGGVCNQYLNGGPRGEGHNT
jgi:hypothetical protein